MTHDPDLSEFEKLSKPKKKPCAVNAVIELLEDLPAKQLHAALERPDTHITNAAISQWLDTRGHSIAWQMIASHRRKACPCHRG